jgi:hypothetical protein
MNRARSQFLSGSGFALISTVASTVAIRLMSSSAWQKIGEFDQVQTRKRLGRESGVPPMLVGICGHSSNPLRNATNAVGPPMRCEFRATIHDERECPHVPMENI